MPTRILNASVSLLVQLLILHPVFGYQDSGAIAYRPWPHIPVDQAGNELKFVSPCELQIETLAGDLNVAVAMYSSIIRKLDPDCQANSSRVDILTIKVAETTVDFPTIETDESYSLEISSISMVLVAKTYSGLLRGLETFSQIIVSKINNRDDTLEFFIPNIPWIIQETPSFKHRGLLLDPARTFIPMEILKQTVDGLMWSKMNVLHLHLTDSQSIPFVFDSLLNVSSAGAFSEKETYTATAMAELVDHARLRGVRVIPELDSPGHARAWGLAIPTITTCSTSVFQGGNYSKYCAEPPCGQFNPARNETYEVLGAAFSDLVQTFEDKTIHLGYDEVNFHCWQDDETTNAYMKLHSLSPHSLLDEFHARLRKGTFPASTGGARSATFWEEVVENNLALEQGDVVQLWSNTDMLQKTLNNYRDTKIIISWAHKYYLDCGRGNMFGDESWCDPFKTALSMYNSDPLEGFTPETQDRALGGEACMWGELMDPNSLAGVVWPRAAAYGARLWNNNEAVFNDTETILSLSGHAHRLRSRGLDAERVTQRFCSISPHLCFGQPDSKPSSSEHDYSSLVVGVSTGGVAVIVITIFICVAMKLKKKKGGHTLRMNPNAVRRPTSVDRHRTSAKSPLLLANNNSALTSTAPTTTITGGRYTPRNQNQSWNFEEAEDDDEPVN